MDNLAVMEKPAERLVFYPSDVFSVPMIRCDILNILPYGDESLFVDRVNNVVKNEEGIWQIEAEVKIPQERFSGHFRDYPVVPGILVQEALQQAGGILLIWALRDSKNDGVLGGMVRQVSKVDYKAMVEPGKLIQLEATLEQFRSPLAIFSGQALVDGKVVVTIGEWKIFLIKKRR